MTRTFGWKKTIRIIQLQVLIRLQVLSVTRLTTVRLVKWLVSAQDALLGLMSERLNWAHERGDMEAIDELEQMQANCCL